MHQYCFCVKEGARASRAHARRTCSAVVGQGMALAGAGMAAGVAGALLVSRLLGTLLFGVSAGDPAIYAAAAVFGAVALGACYFPAWRAAGVDPMVTLRYE